MKKTETQTFWEHCKSPSRVVWAVAEHAGRRSICPLGWKMRTSGSPPMVAISVAPSRYTHDLISASGDFVLSWPGGDLADATLLCGTCSGRDTDKFARAGLTPLPAEKVGAPLVKECVANLECRLAGRLTSGDHTIFTGEILAAWIREKPEPLLCLTDRSAGYEILLEKGGYRFGVVRE